MRPRILNKKKQDKKEEKFVKLYFHNVFPLEKQFSKLQSS